MEPADRQFSIPAYLAAVVAGCLFFGVMLPFADLLAGRPPQPFEPLLFAACAVMAGFLPGLLLCLPITLLGFWFSQRFNRLAPRWYALFGALNGFCLTALFSLPWTAAFPDNAQVAIYLMASGMLSGTLAGLTYRWIERLERNRAVAAPAA